VYRSIVAGTDGSRTSRAAVAAAAELARITRAQLHLVIAYKAGEQKPAAPTTTRLVVDEDPARGDAVGHLARIAEDIKSSGVAVTTHWRSGDAATALLEIAAESSADVIVVGNRGMQGMRRVLGSVPDKVSHHAKCSVLIVATS
jgi:nucleotide-binding universal stress UspA family protein